MLGDYSSKSKINYRMLSVMLSSSAHPCVPLELI